MAKREYRFYVYILGSLAGTLYIGATSKLECRVGQHKLHEFPGFTAKYGVDRLLYFERYSNIRTAIAREKQLIKGWRRKKKIALIEARNPQWQDLSREWFADGRGPSTPEALHASSAQDDIERI